MVKKGQAQEEKLEARYERYKFILQNLTIMSDIFMRNVFKKWECTEYVLRIIMEQKDLKVIDQVLQKDYKNLQGRSAVLDCVVRDSEGKEIDVELQQDNEGASPKRARYHSGLMDMNTLNSGQSFDELPESYVIFITQKDVLGHGLPIYHVNRKIEELNEDFQDEAHIIYVNSEKQEDTELGRLMHNLHCKNAEEMHCKILADRVHELKETQEGVKFMCHELEQLYYEGIETGEKRGIEKGEKIGIEKGEKKGELSKAKEIALSLTEMGFSIEQIAQAVKVNIDTVQQWIKENVSNATANYCE